MTKYILWDPERSTLGPHEPDYFCEIDLARKQGIELFANADEIVTDPDAGQMLAQDPRKKVVIKHWRNCDGPNASSQDLSWANLVILYTNDVITGPWQSYYDSALQQFNNANFICVTEGRANMLDHPKDRVYEDHEHHSNRIVDFCHYEPWIDHEPKTRVFDALLGSTDPVIKPHRIFVYDKLKEHHLLDQSFVNIWGARNYRTPELKQIDDPAIKNYRNSMIYTNNFLNGKSMSHSIPIQIYKQSWYSIVGETMAHKSNYITEKTSKCLFEKRIFVLFGAEGVLKRLRELGYQTFDKIIDEGYDQQGDHNLRWSMAFNEVLKLQQANHKKLYDQVQNILEHNQSCIISNCRNRFQGLKNFLDRHINNL